MDDETLGKLLAEVHRDYADYRCPEGVSVSPSSMSVMVDRTGKLVERSDIDHFVFSVRNVYSAQNQFPVITQAERMVDRTGKPVEEIIGIAEERESSSAQIRTLFNEQRRTIIAECCETVSHHELQAARAEQERKILQEESWRQQQDFREVHQENLTEMKELQKFQSSTFDTLTRARSRHQKCSAFAPCPWRIRGAQRVTSVCGCVLGKLGGQTSRENTHRYHGI